MIANRLQKLEKDLNLLTAFQSLLLTNCENETENDNNLGSNISLEIPERDSCGVQRHSKRLLKTIPYRNHSKIDESNSTTTTVGDSDLNCCKKALSDDATNPDIVGKQEPNVVISETENQLKHELTHYKEKYTELEKSAKLILRNLRKIEDELSREKDTKKTLLVGTLQLKTNLQKYENQCNSLQAECKENQREKAEYLRKLEAMEKEKTEIELQKAVQLDRLSLEKRSLENDNQHLQENLQTLQRQFEELQKQYSMSEQNLSDQDRKANSQLYQMVTKCSQIYKEKEKLLMENSKILEKSENLNEELIRSKKCLNEWKVMYEREKVFNECNAKKLAADRTLEKQRIDEQLRACHGALVRAKAMFVGFQKERNENSISLKRTKDELVAANHNREVMRKASEALEMQSRDIRSRLNSIVMQNKEEVQQFEEQIRTLQADLKACTSDKISLTKTLSRQKTSISLERKEFAESKANFEKEQENMREEGKRLQQNYQIIQKVSEDQGQTIHKLRGDLEELRKCNFSLESQLRDRDAEEKVLVERLESEARNCRRLEDQIEELRYRLAEMEEDLREHSCQDFVDSLYREKLDRIEEKLKARYSAWQEALGATKSERDEAVTAARKSQMDLEEAKAKAENRVLEILSSSRQENAKLQAENHRITSEKANKIYEMESELERLKLQSTQMQRSLSAKIQQLQCALNICIGSNSTAFSNGMGPPGFGNIFI